MQARDVMTTDVITVGPDTDVAETAKRLLENRISALPVIEPNGRIVGIVSEGDLMRRTESGTERHPSWWLSLLLLPERRAIDYVKAHGRRTGDVMTREVITVNDDASLEEIAELLEKHRIKRVPVIRGDRLVGIVSRANLLHGLVAGRTGGDPSADDRNLKVAVEKGLSDAGVRAQLLNVVTSGGVVYVWGVVVTPEEKAAVRAAVESSPGVKDIRANVDVLPTYMRPFMRAG
jgi:CBS domain-containing protein